MNPMAAFYKIYVKHDFLLISVIFWNIRGSKNGAPGHDVHRSEYAGKPGFLVIQFRKWQKNLNLEISWPFVGSKTAPKYSSHWTWCACT